MKRYNWTDVRHVKHQLYSKSTNANDLSKPTNDKYMKWTGLDKTNEEKNKNSRYLTRLPIATPFS